MSCEVSAFTLALDMSLGMQRCSFPAASGTKVDGSWASCFQISNQEQTSLPASICDKDKNTECHEHYENVDVVCDKKLDTATTPIVPCEEHSKSPLPPNSPKDLPTRTLQSAEKYGIKQLLLRAEVSNHQSHGLSVNIDCVTNDSLDNVEQEIAINQEFDVMYRLVTKRPALDPPPPDHQEEERLDEIISAAEILFSCRNVTPDAGDSSPKASAKRRKTDPAQPCTRKHPQGPRKPKACTPARDSPAPARYSRAAPASPGATRRADDETDASDAHPRSPPGVPRSPSWRRTGTPPAEAACGGVSPWAAQLLAYLQQHGQNLLASICAHYRIDYAGDPALLRAYSLEQLAHNALFNPALPKFAGTGLPTMLRDVDGVTAFRMAFPRDPATGVPRGIARVSARLAGEAFTAEVRACSYCGSCFSGRFMKPNAMHQLAGGWKEITHRTAAGRFSWEPLLGRRLCVPCFTHWAANGTNANANRPSIDDTTRLLAAPPVRSPSTLLAAAAAAAGTAQGADDQAAGGAGAPAGPPSPAAPADALPAGEDGAQ